MRMRKATLLLLAVVLTATVIAPGPLFARQRECQGSSALTWYQQKEEKRDRTDFRQNRDAQFNVGFALANRDFDNQVFGYLGVVLGDPKKASQMRVQAAIQYFDDVGGSFREEFPPQRMDYERARDIEDRIKLVVPTFDREIHWSYVMFDRSRSGRSLHDIIDDTNGGLFYDVVVDNKMVLRRGDKWAGMGKFGGYDHDDVEFRSAAEEVLRREMLQEVLRAVLPELGGLELPER